MTDAISRESLYEKLHAAGGCDAAEEWAKGYDSGINDAIRLVQKEPSVCVKKTDSWKLQLIENIIADAFEFNPTSPTSYEVMVGTLLAIDTVIGFKEEEPHAQLDSDP